MPPGNIKVSEAHDPEFKWSCMGSSYVSWPQPKARCISTREVQEALAVLAVACGSDERADSEPRPFPDGVHAVRKAKDRLVTFVSFNGVGPRRSNNTLTDLLCG